MIDTVIARVGSHVFPCVGVRLRQQRRNRVHRGGENSGCGGGHGSILAAVEHEQGDEDNSVGAGIGVSIACREACLIRKE